MQYELEVAIGDTRVTRTLSVDGTRDSWKTGHLSLSGGEKDAILRTVFAEMINEVIRARPVQEIRMLRAQAESGRDMPPVPGTAGWLG